MKTHLKLLIPAVLLLVTATAFAQGINYNPEYQSYPEYKNFLKAKENVVTSVKYICKGDKYCESYAVLLAKISPSMKEVNEKLRNERNYKQALYNIKYSLANNPDKSGFVELLDVSEIEKLSTFTEFKDYVTDMPLTKDALFISYMKLLELAKSDEELATSKRLIEAVTKYDEVVMDEDAESQRKLLSELYWDSSDKDLLTKCSGKLNIKEYWQNAKLCYIPVKFNIVEPLQIRESKVDLNILRNIQNLPKEERIHGEYMMRIDKYDMNKTKEYDMKKIDALVKEMEDKLEGIDTNSIEKRIK